MSALDDLARELAQVRGELDSASTRAAQAHRLMDEAYVLRNQADAERDAARRERDEALASAEGWRQVAEGTGKMMAELRAEHEALRVDAGRVLKLSDKAAPAGKWFEAIDALAARLGGTRG